MDLWLYDTLEREKRLFRPLAADRVRIYVCGPTVYDFAHIGNARPIVVFDVLFRLLRHLYGAEHVAYIRNITDVDDKINARAAQEYPDRPLNEAIRAVTTKTEQQFHDDVAALGALAPTLEPRATEHIGDMKRLIERLLESGHAYVAEDHVMFSVASMRDYGALSKRPLEEMIAGARVEVAPYKRDPMDFVLWKPSKAGEPAWPSPAAIAAPGRPGWHIECSAMAWKHLGETFDIHGGGIDLVFPHHENEIAQSRCAFHSPFMANYWMHNGFLQVEGEKMSKSLGNFFTIRELLDQWPGDVLRMQMLMTHYRLPLDWTERKLLLAQMELEDWAHVLQGHYGSQEVEPAHEVLEPLCDDLNTSDAITALREMYSRAKIGGLKEKTTFANSCKFLGFKRLGEPGLFSSFIEGKNVSGNISQYAETITRLRAATANDAPESIKSRLISKLTSDRLSVHIEKNGRITIVGTDQAFTDKINGLVEARTVARRAKNFQEADRIRHEIEAMGIELYDNKDGTTTWKMVQ